MGKKASVGTQVEQRGGETQDAGTASQLLGATPPLEGPPTGAGTWRDRKPSWAERAQRHPGLALTGRGWAGGGTFGTQGPRRSGGPGQGYSPYSSCRHYSWLGESSRRLLRSLQTVHPGREMESVRALPPGLARTQHPMPAPLGPFPPGWGPAAGCEQVQGQETAGSPPPDGPCRPHSPQPCAGTLWLWRQSAELTLPHPHTPLPPHDPRWPLRKVFPNFQVHWTQTCQTISLCSMKRNTTGDPTVHDLGGHRAVVS